MVQSKMTYEECRHNGHYGVNIGTRYDDGGYDARCGMWVGSPDYVCGEYFYVAPDGTEYRSVGDRPSEQSVTHEHICTECHKAWTCLCDYPEQYGSYGPPNFEGLCLECEDELEESGEKTAAHLVEEADLQRMSDRLDEMGGEIETIKEWIAKACEMSDLQSEAIRELTILLATESGRLTGIEQTLEVFRHGHN